MFKLKGKFHRLKYDKKWIRILGQEIYQLSYLEEGVYEVYKQTSTSWGEDTYLMVQHIRIASIEDGIKEKGWELFDENPEKDKL